MDRIAKFEKVSFNQFENDVLKNESVLKYTDKSIKEIYDAIELPVRATKGSAGYDFKCPFDGIFVNHIQGITIPTGIRVKIEDGWSLSICPRSGLGFKYGIELVNTIGIIDSDYYYSDNEGHIMVKLTRKFNDGAPMIMSGDSFAQGIFYRYGITIDDEVSNIRNGGFGSTTNKK